MNIFGFIKLVALLSASLYEIASKSISTHAIQAILTENVTDAIEAQRQNMCGIDSPHNLESYLILLSRNCIMSHYRKYR